MRSVIRTYFGAFALLLAPQIAYGEDIGRPTTHAMKLTQSTWSPFQSPEVREICANLTPAEHAQIIAHARERGTDIWRWIVALFGSIAAMLVWSWQVGLLLLPLVIIYFAASGLPRLRAMRRRSKELLCETEWGRSRGYTPERLRLMTLPWTR